MITLGEVTNLYKTKLPQYSADIDDFSLELGEGDAYPVTVGLLHAISKALRANPDDESAVKAFFNVCETLLVDGDEHVQDCIVLEAIQPVALPPLKDLRLERFLGPTSKKELRNYLECR